MCHSNSRFLRRVTLDKSYQSSNQLDDIAEHVLHIHQLYTTHDLPSYNGIQLIVQYMSRTLFFAILLKSKCSLQITTIENIHFELT